MKSFVAERETGSHHPELRFSRFDFRRPNRLSREAIAGLEVAHEVFARRVGSTWGKSLRAIARLEPLAVDEVSYDHYLRSMPNPTVVGIVDPSPLPGSVLVEMNAQLALVLIDRLLGGRPSPSTRAAVAPRRPTDLETVLLSELLGQAVAALAETLAPVNHVEPELTGIEYNPQLVQVAAPSDRMVLLTYGVKVSQGVDVEGMLSICYPATLISPLVDMLVRPRAGDADGRDPDARGRMVAQLEQVPVEVDVGLRLTPVDALDLVELRPGDVLRIEHRVDQPVVGRIAGREVLEGHVGRRGRRLALQFTRWLVDDPEEELT